MNPYSSNHYHKWTVHIGAFTIIYFEWVFCRFCRQGKVSALMCRQQSVPMLHCHWQRCGKQRAFLLAVTSPIPSSTVRVHLIWNLQDFLWSIPLGSRMGVLESMRVPCATPYPIHWMGYCDCHWLTKGRAVTVTVGNIISPRQKFASLSPISEYLSEIHSMLFHYILCIFKGEINGIYTKGLLDREDFYKCLSLPFSDQHAFQSKKKLILLDFTGAAMLAISWRKKWHGRFCRYYFLHVKGLKFRTRLVAMAKNIPQLFRSLKDRQSKWPSRTKNLVNMMGEGQRIRLYCVLITGWLSHCRFEYALWLAETTFFYGADNTAEQPLNCILTPYHEFDVTASCLF